MPETRAYLSFTAGEPLTFDDDSGEVTFDNDTRTFSEYGISREYHVASDADPDFNGAAYDPDLVEWPLPETGFPDELGIAPAAEIDLTLVEQDGRTYRQLDDEDQVEGVSAKVTLVKDLPQDDGSTTQFTYPRTMTISRTEMQTGALRIRLTDTLAESFDQLYPTEKYSTSDWPDIYPEHQGRVVPYSVGSATHPARHVPGTIVAFDSGTGETKVAFGKPGGGSINTIYRGRPGERATVDASEYTVANESGFLVATFPEPQKDRQGRFYSFSADVVGTDDRNVWAEIQRHIERLGMTVDSTSFTAAKSKATSWDALVTCDYGSSNAGQGQRATRAILQDLLLIGRGAIHPDGDGNWVAVADDSGASSKTYNQNNDLVDVGPMPRVGRRESITLQFGVAPEDPTRTAFEIERTVPTGRLPAGDPVEARFLPDGTAADKLAYYLALKEENNRRGVTRVWDQQYDLGDVITLENEHLFDGSRTVKVWNRAPTEIGDDLTVVTYFDPDTYVAGTIPPASTQGYVADFSATDPDAPTSLSKDDEGVTEDNEGNFTYWVEATATPPAENYEVLVFVAVEDPTSGSGAIAAVVDGDELTAGGDWQAKIAGLKTNVAYRLDCYARNRFDRKGAVTSIDFTTTTDAGDPPDPTSVQISQKTALYGEAFVTATEPPDFLRYEYQIWSPAATSWGSTRKAGNQDSFIWALQNYESGQKIRVRLVDKSENTSGWVESNTINPSRNVGNADLADDSVSTTRIVAGNVTTDRVADLGITTDKRQVLNSVSAGSQTIAPGRALNDSIPHNEGTRVTAIGGGLIDSSSTTGFGWTGHVSVSNIELFIYNSTRSSGNLSWSGGTLYFW